MQLFKICIIGVDVTFDLDLDWYLIKSWDVYEIC